ncbi:hypothetical protein GCM10023340_25120 [Nocardioides marinquilinus]|uniref:Uncharacterized protein n=1 Tax=Nocardioides marinquilinus TaxID=1210400 RepID=A0ABP9PNI2_9ACTN
MTPLPTGTSAVETTPAAAGSLVASVASSLGSADVDGSAGVDPAVADELDEELAEGLAGSEALEDGLPSSPHAASTGSARPVPAAPASARRRVTGGVVTTGSWGTASRK